MTKRMTAVDKVVAGHMLGRTIAQAIEALRDEMSPDALCPLTEAQRKLWQEALTRLTEAHALAH